VSATTGIILMTGTVTVVNASIFHDKPVDWRVPIATGFAALIFNGLERAAPKPAVLLAWTGLIVVLFSRTDPRVPSPTESLLDWWEGGRG
jgi:hypothetical protein